MEMRYQAQFHDVEVAGIPDGDLTTDGLQQAVEAFHRRHEELYTFSLRFYGAEVRGLRILAKVKRAGVPLQEIAAGDSDPAPALKRQRCCFFDGRFIRTPIYEGALLKAGDVIDGPAVIEEPTTTVVVPSQWDCRVDNYGSYSIKRS
jgi:N-methylhydantoinase A